jgi:hypothetical protein
VSSPLRHAPRPATTPRLELVFGDASRSTSEAFADAVQRLQNGSRNNGSRNEEGVSGDER